MRVILATVSVILIIVFGSFHKKRIYADDLKFKRNIKFNHLFVVIDDSAYKYLFDSLTFLKTFAKTDEETTDAGSVSWSGKYVFGVENYLEILKPGGIKGSKLGEFGLGFMTNKLGTIDTLRSYWEKTLDSVHVEHTVTTTEGKTLPWFTSVSIPPIDSLKMSAWVFENSKEEMKFAGYTDSDLTKEIEFSDYNRHVTAKMGNIPIDSVRYNKLFDRINSLDISLSHTELSYLRHCLLDIGFSNKKNSFFKNDFRITYSVSDSAHFLLNWIGFSLLRKVPKERHSFRNIDMIVDGDKAVMTFK